LNPSANVFCASAKEKIDPELIAELLQ
jgi:hypothetical protein